MYLYTFGLYYASYRLFYVSDYRYMFFQVDDFYQIQLYYLHMMYIFSYIYLDCSNIYAQIFRQSTFFTITSHLFDRPQHVVYFSQLQGRLATFENFSQGGLENVLFTLGLALREGFKVQGAGSFDRFYKHVLGKFKNTISYVIFIFIYHNGFFDRLRWG